MSSLKEYKEKRKKGKERVFKKIIEDNKKHERIMSSREHPIAIKNENIINSMYKGLTLTEKKLYRFVLSIIKKDDDINSTFILNHKSIKELFNHNYTSKEIHDMLYHISISFNTKNSKGEYYHIPIFKMIKTSEKYETTEVIFNEFFSGILFFNSKEGRFLKYSLGLIMDYKNLYSPELFEILYSLAKQNYRDEIVRLDFNIDELKATLNCENKENKDFIKQVIKKSIEEINRLNICQLGGNIAYTYNRTKKTISFYFENLAYMIKESNKK